MLMKGGSGSSNLSELGEWLKELFPHGYIWSASKAFLKSPYKFSVGLIIQPGVRTDLSGLFQLVTNPVQLANYWGHTAVFVRENHKVVKTIGYDPDRLRMFTNPPVGLGVGKGTRGTPGVFYDEDQMFNSPDALVIEFEVPHKVTRKLLGAFPPIGCADETPKQVLKSYVTRGGQRLQGTFDRRQMGNCLDFQDDMLMKKFGFGIDPKWLQEVGSGQGAVTRAVLARTLKVKDYSDGKRPMGHRYQSMSPALQVSRRVGGTLRTISLVRCVYKALRMLATLLPFVDLDPSGPFMFEILFAVSWLADFLELALPRGRWQLLPTKLIETVVATGAAISLVLTIYNGFDESAWINPLLTYAWILTASFA